MRLQACLLSHFSFSFGFLGLRYNSPDGCRCTFEYSWDRCAAALVMFDLVWVMSRSWCFLITFRTPFFGLSLWWFFTYFDLFGFWIIIQSPNASFGSSQLVSHFGEGWNMAILKPAGTSRHADSNTEDFRWGGSLCLHQRVNEAADLLHRSSTLLRLWALHMELLRNLCLDRQALPPPHRFVRRVTRTASTVPSASGKANLGSPRRSST